MKTFCASDLHLGYECTNYDKVCKFLDMVKSKSDELILCGDTFDLWRYPVAKIDKTTMVGFKEALEQLKETANEIPIKVIPGNHDYNLQKVWNKNLRKDYNVEITNSFYRGDIYFTHGWEFDVKQRLGSFAYEWLVTSFPYLYQKWFKKPSQMGLINNDLLRNMSEMVHNEAEEYAIKNNLKYVVMGHTHIPTIFNHVIDCGDFIDSCSYIIIANKEPIMKFI